MEKDLTTNKITKLTVDQMNMLSGGETTSKPVTPIEGGPAEKGGTYACFNTSPSLLGYQDYTCTNDYGGSSTIY